MNNELLEKHLIPGEKILWSGRPGIKNVFHRSDIIVIPFTLAFCVFAAFWEYTALNAYLRTHRTETLLFAIVGAILLIAGLHQLAGRFFFSSYTANKTWYALTGWRAIIITKLLWTNVRSIELGKTGAIRKHINKDGTGTISFGNDKIISGTHINSYFDPVVGYNRISYNNYNFINKAAAFVDIENVENVSNIIAGITGIKKQG
jgi:hypothetical protein